MADLGNGKFDGANLVLNFESLSPGNTWFKKYFNLYARRRHRGRRASSSSSAGGAATS